jgi:DNA-binding MarR family transcriptional regulator
MMIEREFVKHLIKRLARIDADDGWRDGLNPAQRMTLEYLARANRFSRRPSQVATFMGSTRGTISQTLKSLATKGYIAEERSEQDKRSISYRLTDQGKESVSSPNTLDRSLEGASKDVLSNLAGTLRAVLDRAIEQNEQKPFGVCKQCQHFAPRKTGGYCKLLEVVLEQSEIDQICFEQSPA